MLKLLLCKIGWQSRKRLVWISRRTNHESKIKPQLCVLTWCQISCTAIKQVISIYYLFAIHVWWLDYYIYYLMICVLLVDSWLVFEKFQNIVNGIHLRLFHIDHSCSFCTSLINGLSVYWPNLQGQQNK